MRQNSSCAPMPISGKTSQRDSFAPRLENRVKADIIILPALGCRVFQSDFSRAATEAGFFFPMILRIKKREAPYVQIDKRPLENPALSWRAKGILCYLLSKPNEWAVRVEDILRHGEEGRDAVRAAMAELRALGYATLVNTREGKEWNIFEEPIEPSPEKPSMEPSPEKPTPEKANVGKSAASNNNTEVKMNSVILSSSPNGDLFSAFWQKYPRKVGRGSALKVWQRKKCNAIAPKIMATLERAKASPDWRKDAGQFIPHPTTWLNREGWEDDFFIALEKPRPKPPENPPRWREFLQAHGHKYEPWANALQHAKLAFAEWGASDGESARGYGAEKGHNDQAERLPAKKL